MSHLCLGVCSGNQWALLNSISIKVEGKLYHLKVVYDWKSSLCGGCNSFFHNAAFFPLNPTNPPPIQGKERREQNLYS